MRKVLLATGMSAMAVFAAGYRRSVTLVTVEQERRNPQWGVPGQAYEFRRAETSTSVRQGGCAFVRSGLESAGVGWSRRRDSRAPQPRGGSQCR